MGGCQTSPRAGLLWTTSALSVEHYYQAQKYAGTEAEERIRRADSSLKARKVGQDRSLVPRADWDSVKEDVMRRAVRAKFEQNRRLRERLLATGGEELVHKSGTDLFWGRNQHGVGDNRLGLVLMEIREAIGGLGDTTAAAGPCRVRGSWSELLALRCC
jgi:ribA/ribD-fused uncharacterized protein